MVMEVVHEDMGEGNMQCTNHPYKSSTPPGGICSFCLQEKLGKLVSSSFPVHVFPTSSSSSSPSFRSDIANGVCANDALKNAHLVRSSSSVSNPQIPGTDCNSYHGYCNARRSRLLFILTTQKRKKKKDGAGASDSTGILFKRSKSTATPRRGTDYWDGKYGGEDYSPQRRGFWSFLYLSKHYSTVKRSDKSSKDLHFPPTRPRTVSSSCSSTVASSSSVNGVLINTNNNRKREELVVVDENGSPEQASFNRKVSRSRSVGCGSRSFSGDFFERISTGFGDCTLRRVESQREGKHKVQSSLHRNCANNGHERVRCGGIFSGFMITSSSSSSSSSSQWVSTLAEEVSNTVNGKSTSASSSSAHSTVRSHLSHGRSRSWGWALASPMRAFSKNSSSTTGKRDSVASNKNVTLNLAAIPSMLTVSG